MVNITIIQYLFLIILIKFTIYLIINFDLKNIIHNRYKMKCIECYIDNINNNTIYFNFPICDVCILKPNYHIISKENAKNF